ncbi:MAG: GH32 C-terminal domain-containing protein, partial [Pirellulales bacterium]
MKLISIASLWPTLVLIVPVLATAADAPEAAVREIVVTRRYLHLPVTTGAPVRRITLRNAGRSVRQFDICLATDKPDFVVFVDIGRWRGKRLMIDAGKLVGGAKALASIVQSDAIPGQSHLYRERHRPQFHFTSRRGWLNDPNGLVYYQGEWHLFYQHNPYGWKWGNMHWGHAVSRDLVHWTELGDAIHPWSDCKGAAFSGSAVVDWKNTSGFQSGQEHVLVAIYTDTGAGESIAYSNDRGRTWTMFPNNPVVKHSGRDPKVIWHRPTNRWVMAVYDQVDDKRYIAFYSSHNLKEWTFESRIEGFFECPDLFELPVDGDEANSRWVLHAADGQYVLGDFDGHAFHPDHDGKHQTWYGNYYAGQSYFAAPDGRRVQIGWGRGVTFPNMPFNQQMTIPVNLTLRATADGIRMFAEPVDEIHALVDHTSAQADVALGKEPHTIDVAGELLDITATFAIADSTAVGLSVHGVEIVYDVAKKAIDCGTIAPLEPIDGRITLRVLADRGSIEVFGNHGRVAISHGILADKDQTGVALFARGGTARLSKLVAHTLKSAW